MKALFKSVALLAVTAIISLANPVKAQLVVTEFMYNPLGNDAVYEWFEVVNTSANAIDLNGAMIADKGFFRDDFSVNIDNAFDPTTVIGPGETAVFYDGEPNGFPDLNYDEDAFRTAWSIPAATPVIGVRFWTSLSNGGDTLGIWTDDSSTGGLSALDKVLADSTPRGTTSSAGANEFDVTSFNNVLGANTAAPAIFAYDDSSPWPTETQGTSIAWSGTGSVTNPSTWANSSTGDTGVVTSLPNNNSEGGLSDLASPGAIKPSALPGTPNTGLVISEIMYDTVLEEPAFEWIEIYNNSDTAVNLAGYVLDDGNNTPVSGTDANITSGAIDANSAAVLYNSATTLAAMESLWGTGINFIPVDQWPSLNNIADADAPIITDGANDVISLWASRADYDTDAIQTDNSIDLAVTSVEFAEFDVDGDPNTLEDNWVPAGVGSSLVLLDLDTDESVGANWGVAGDLNDVVDPITFDTFSFGFENPPIAYVGGEIGSPGVFNGTIEFGLPGDFNDDGTVDAADFVIWRDLFGADGGGDVLGLNGNGNTDLVVDESDYLVWVANYGTSASSSTSAAVPEPTAALLLLAGVAGLLARRNG